MAFDFKGNLLSSARKLAPDYTTQPHWSDLAAITDADDVLTAADSLLETETFTSSATYDALNRIVTSTSPDASIFTPTYNDAGLLETIDVFVRGDVSATSFVSNIDYDAHGRRTSIEYANGTTTAYTYDALTFRLATLVTTKSTDVLQDLSYTFDPVGNIVAIADAAQQTLFFDNTASPAGSKYEYDPTYRLVSATGREHAGNVQADQSDVIASATVPHANDANAVKPYVEEYTYDKVANLVELAHTMTGSSPGTWSRTYTYQGPRPSRETRTASHRTVSRPCPTRPTTATTTAT